jgi:pimeloyl-ACP methyl ester carboxylesterase
MQLLFVHGMGRSPLSGWPLLRKLRQHGLQTQTFGYMTSLEDVAGITARLRSRLVELAASGDHVLVGHSLGGVLLRAALNSLPPDTRRPKHVFLLGSPIQPSRLAQRLRHNPVFRIATRDCGNLLGSPERMAAIGALDAPVTGIAGVRGLAATQKRFFGDEPNDGVVSLGEVCAPWLSDRVDIPVVHTLLPASTLAARVILDRLGRPG